jgi:hypothetical protein
LCFELIADLAYLIGFRFATRTLEIDQIKTRFPKNIVTATLSPGIAKSTEEVAKVIKVDTGVALSRHQLFERFFSNCSIGTIETQTLGFLKKNLRPISTAFDRPPFLTFRNDPR